MLNESLIPIVVGVAGHRDLREKDKQLLAQRVRETLQEVRRCCPSSPLIVLSSLAEGADSLAAEAALELGATLIAPLPFDEKEYIKDFKTNKAKDYFKSLLSKSQYHFSITQGTVKRTVERDIGYARCGDYIATHCHILLALWDGVHKDTVAGTSQVVRAKLDGIAASQPHSLGIVAKADTGPVWQIITPRPGQNLPAGEPGTLIRHYCSRKRHGHHEADGEAFLGQIEAFNRDAVRAAQEHPGAVEQEFAQCAAQWGPLDATGQRILYRHALASALSLQYQRKRHRILFATFGLGVAAFGCLEFYEYFYASLFHHDPRAVLLLVGYIAILLLAYGVFAVAAWRKYQNRHLDYRALAEGLRVQFYWTVAGMADDVSDFYLTKHSGELAWIRQAIRIGNIANGCVNRGSRLTGAARAKQLLDKWVRDQRDYYQRVWRRNERKGHRQELLTNGCFGLAVLIAAGMIFAHRALADLELMHSLLGYAISISFALAAAAGGYAEKMVFGEQAKQYNRMAHQFDDAAEALERVLAAGDLAGAEALLREVGREALSENSDWVMLHRSRPLEVPRGG